MYVHFLMRGEIKNESEHVPGNAALSYFQSFLTMVPKMCYRCARSILDFSVPTSLNLNQVPVRFDLRLSYE